MSVSDNDRQDNPSLSFGSDILLCVSTSPHARAKRRIAALVEEVENLKQHRATKQRSVCSRPIKAILMLCDRKTTYYVSQGRVICRMVVLYTPIEDLIAENDRHCEDSEAANSTLE
jgi:uncharacterized small protein (DUF1192 family)